MLAAVDHPSRAVKAKKTVQDEIDPDEGYADGRTPAQQWLEFVLICACNVAWTIDGALLPMFFTEFQALFGVSETSLSMLSTVKGWVAALFAFPCGFLGELLPRPRLVALGMLFWSAGLAVCAGATSFNMLFTGRVFNGIGLGIVQPLLFSMVADKNAPSKRGSAFGWVFFMGALGSTVFGLVATSSANAVAGGIAVWRLSVLAVIVFSAALAVLVWLFVQEPNEASIADRRRTEGFASVFVNNMPKVLQLFKYPSFVLILLQGAPGTAPWTVFPFFTQWLELSCFTHKEAAFMYAAFGWGMACSNMVSGLLLNFVARRFPDHGPPSIANFSVASGVPFLVLLFFVLPKPAMLGEGGGEVFPYFAAFLCFGLGAAMCGTLNKKVFSDIVPSEIFNYVFAIDQLVENVFGNFAGLAVGLVTDKVFHYDAEAVTEGQCAPEEGRKLGMGMFVVCLVAWSICFTVYTGLHCTYPRDRRRQLELRHAQAKGKEADAQAAVVELGDGGMNEREAAREQ